MTDNIYTVIGIGFGPSNLGLALAITEHNNNENDDLSMMFLEGKSAFSWHPEMLLPGATMQVSFLKDLVTMRDATSEYSFLSYLQDKDRLADFVNLSTFYPRRTEFTDYLRWCERRIREDNYEDIVTYDSYVISVSHQHGLFVVTTSDGVVRRARNVVLGGGISASLPAFVDAGTRQFHSHGLLSSLRDFQHKIGDLDNASIAVIGAGQSAAEVSHYLYSQYENTKVYSVISSFGYVPADNSPYVNRIFDPASVDSFYNAPADVRSKIRRDHKATNNAAPDLDIIKTLYDIEYEEKVGNNSEEAQSTEARLHMYNVSRVVGAEETPEGVELTIATAMDSKKTFTQMFDAVVYATGFEQFSPARVLDQETALLFGDTPGRDYRLPTELSGDIYLNGGVEESHGLTSSLLSNIAVRSGEITKSLVEHRWEK